MKMLPGEMICDGVRLERALKEGGMGTVWLAENVRLGAQVAVKVMSPSLAKDPSAVARFTREARLASRVRSPHVVQIFDCRLPASEDGEDALPFMVMEHLEGEDVAARLERGTLSVSETAEIVTQVSRALGVAHANGVVHRDVKPENIFLAPGDGRPFAKLLDFGIAKDAHDIALDVTAAGATIGTPHYMSPEQMLTPKEVDGRCDLWALGVVAYVCLTKRLPFEGDTFGALIIRIHRGEYPPPSSVDPRLPRAVDAWFERALHRDIARRFQTAREMSDALIEVAYGRRVESLARLTSPRASEPSQDFSEATPPPSVREVPRAKPGDEKEDGRMGLVAAAVVALGVLAVGMANAIAPRGDVAAAAPPRVYDAAIGLDDAPDPLAADAAVDAALPVVDAAPLKK